ncbi:DUF1801 domain-containing protein [Mucilaginibacter paludis]|uniref:YdhG-like domain-containing protein n=1 Tax=Mucilaginibacter paludis DSM 18603 TaxID=714943 RepID=H1YDL2_9SPHI|nr:DUF1801 domain-containing protein [Mucilaginibacter paludis]EHQ30701.1 protein of unknown function DUF1801 [Mucilaginibacter paludis DSM 18603]
MLRDIDNYFLKKDEPAKSSLLYLRTFILAFDAEITESWKYGMPFYCYKNKMLCYLWTKKGTGQPYIGFVDGKLMEHPELIMEKRSRMKIMLIEPAEDVPVNVISEILNVAVKLRN